METYNQLLIFSLFIACLLPIIAKVPLIKAMKKLGGGNINGYDNRHPRQQQAKLEGFGARCVAAHYNSFEALIMFAPGVLAVLALDKASLISVTLAWTFIASRILYLVFYWINKDLFRSLVWAVGIISSLSLLLSAAF